eukprot:1426608-Amphidinium_carterae.1
MQRSSSGVADAAWTPPAGDWLPLQQLMVDEEARGGGSSSTETETGLGFHARAYFDGKIFKNVSYPFVCNRLCTHPKRQAAANTTVQAYVS